ncbi:MAG: hypothetical protein ACRDD8_05230 [Bacteroidales bacterium]
MNTIVNKTLWLENDGVEVVKVLWTKGLQVVFSDMYGDRYKMSQKRFRKIFSLVG